MNNKPVSHLQTDSRWSKKSYANKGESATIGGSGCGPTCMAMVIATWVDSSVTPVDTCAWAQSHGYKATGNGTYQSYFVGHCKSVGLECEKLNSTSIQYMYAKDAEKYHQAAHNYVDDGYLVICLMGPGNWTKGGHYILWYSNDGDDVLINDPASTKSTRLRNKFSLLKDEVRVYWAIKPPKEVISLTNSEVKALVEKTVKEQISSQVASILNGTGNNVPSDWAKTYWYSACKEGLMDGTRPLGYPTREQIATILCAIGECKLIDPPKDFDFSAAKY